MSICMHVACCVCMQLAAQLVCGMIDAHACNRMQLYMQYGAVPMYVYCNTCMHAELHDVV